MQHQVTLPCNLHFVMSQDLRSLVYLSSFGIILNPVDLFLWIVWGMKNPNPNHEISDFRTQTPKLNIFRMDGQTSIKFPRERFAEYELTTEYRTRVSWNISEQILWHLPPDKLHLQILLWKLTLSFCLGGHVCFYTDWQQLVVVSVRNWPAGGTSW